MKIIDEKGKFLGLVNIVDLLVLAAVLLVIGGAVYKIMGQDKVQNAPKSVQVTVLTPAIRPEMLTNVQVGDKMVSGSSFTNVVVKDFKIQPAYMITSDSNGQRVETIDPYLKDVIFTLEGTTVISAGTINLGGQDIRCNKEYYVKSLLYEFKGQVMDVEIIE
ncbi:MAG: DUF4330 domain-containing protein [Desulfotomaculaceae bacterium]|nr:DUF4330 domain-containing protein [Desulfotomaculaceae bacterium]MDD4767017.1 DUF4330 domain-containing protein [Desulfotomaculaceae bacterium]